MDTAGVNVNKNKSTCAAQQEVVKIQREGAVRGAARVNTPRTSRTPSNNRRVADDDYTGPMRGRGRVPGGREGERTF